MSELNVVPTELIETPDVSKTVIVYVSITGAVLVMINAALVACFVLKRRARRLKGKILFCFKIFFNMCKNLSNNNLELKRHFVLHDYLLHS